MDAIHVPVYPPNNIIAYYTYSYIDQTGFFFGISANACQILFISVVVVDVLSALLSPMYCKLAPFCLDIIMRRMGGLYVCSRVWYALVSHDTFMSLENITTYVCVYEILYVCTYRGVRVARGTGSVYDVSGTRGYRVHVDSVLGDIEMAIFDEITSYHIHILKLARSALAGRIIVVQPGERVLVLFLFLFVGEEDQSGGSASHINVDP